MRGERGENIKLFIIKQNSQQKFEAEGDGKYLP